MPRKTDLQQLIINYTRRLQKLKEQQALKGQNTEPDLLIEIEDIETQLAQLQAELATLPDEIEQAATTQVRETKGTKMSDEDKPKEGGIHFGDRTTIHGDVFTGGKRAINTGGGAYIEGSVSTGGGDFVGRDQVKTSGLSAADVAKLFEPIYARIEARPNTSSEDKADLKTDVQELQVEVTKGDKADESFLSRRLRNIQRMAPDILEVVTATLTNPLTGFSSVVTKVAQRMKESAGDN
jgi:hypothetical protein